MVVLLMALLAGGAGDYVKVEVRGRLTTGVMAIGGETTGYTITARGVTWELSFPSAALKARADALGGRTVLVRGNLEVRPGVEMRSRSIVTVTTLREVKGPPQRSSPARD